MVVFDSNEILRQSVVIREKTENISKLTGEIAILCQNISNRIKANDSIVLANGWLKLQGKFEDLKKSVETNGEKLVDGLKRYTEVVQENETEFNKMLEDISSRVSDLAAQLKKLD